MSNMALIARSLPLTVFAVIAWIASGEKKLRDGHDWRMEVGYRLLLRMSRSTTGNG